MVRQAANTVYFWTSLETSLEAGFDATPRILAPRGRPSSGFLPKADKTCKNIPTDIFTLPTEKAPTSAIRKSRFLKVHVARADTTSGSAMAVAIP